ncbi:MAG: 4Fe-4S binding protein [Clostridiales bacterium]|jgi:polyferredoxin|nr:4Fe-4S binding protein [Clostridiales bacterium]
MAATNLNVNGFLTGRVFTGKSKGLCVPGLNCYACPGALFSCPIGALQNALSDPARRFGFYVIGLLALFGVTLGRLVCGLFCPFGFIQDILYMPARLLKKRSRIRIPFAFRRIKYAVLIVMVILLPLTVSDAFGYGRPWFCKYLCPSGVVMGALPILTANPRLLNLTGFVFYLKISVTACIIFSSMFSERFFCKYLCPLGAVYGLFNRISLYRLNLDSNRCVHCGKCEENCPMRVNPSQTPNSPECIRCGKCVSVCEEHALSSEITPGCGLKRDHQ